MAENDADTGPETQDSAPQTQETNPTTHRTIEGPDYSINVPRNQAGVPLVEFFGNAPLPDDLKNAVVYKTDQGHVLAPRDPVALSQEHDAKAAEYATTLRAQIDEKGYYAKTMTLYAEQLSQKTGQPVQDMKAVISRNFQAETGKDPYAYLQEQRQARGLPVRQNEPQQKQTPKQER